MDIYEKIRQCVVEGDSEKATKLIKKAINLKYPPEIILSKGLIGGIDIVTNELKNGSVAIPEILISSRALSIGIEELTPYLSMDKKYKAKILIGTVEGDVHDIGKNIIKTMLKSLELEVIDLGIDISKDEFINAIKIHKPDIVGISALLTTTMKEMKYIIDEMVIEGVRDEVIVFVGGAPVTKKFAKDIGADYYTESAIELRDFLEKNINKIIKKHDRAKNNSI